ncbi:synaptonemal complex central element protein 2 [Xenopus laevis]|uniref:Synaptonemal complex central element protein 2 n=2 Tax=Xenopus laevis TaxID=8355 RepID=A0A1L8H2Z8_XENLA|nr:synaptonemal complex central element protein 2 [Xenopus laevis]OCT90446.1 hypothetical protein XELAEV_18019059mg [Xenopus laevis]
MATSPNFPASAHSGASGDKKAEHELDIGERKEKTFGPSYSREGQTSTQTSSRPQSPSVSNPAPNLTSSSSLEAKSANYFSALDATVEDLQNRAQILIDKINEGRNKDQALMKNFHESLAKKVAELSQCLEARIYHMYDEHNKLLQERLQELPEIMDRIGELQSELKEVCHTVATVYQDLCVPPDV